MSSPSPSNRTVALVAGAVLVIIGALIASLAVFGGSAGAPEHEPSPPPTSAPPTAQPPCGMYDFECQVGGTDGGWSDPSSPPNGTDGGTSGAVGGTH
ncbi:hypothetical protein [Streptomyces sp. NPDC093707]|uniref:hypothetical protein n=1 Tax=Streptomyces sp. NPDC093707 TaxID=3154984 RepID=UPI00344E528E